MTRRGALASLLEDGYFEVPGVVSAEDCARLRASYDEPLFRKTIRMDRDSYGRGEYKYFRYPLPDLVQQLRVDWYQRLVPAARLWMEHIESDVEIPAKLGGFLQNCHSQGQTEATPLMLSYSAGGSNAPHQDKYGRIAFPFQIVIMLSRPDIDFTGGEFRLIEKRSGLEATTTLLRPGQGTAIAFPNQFRPLVPERLARIEVRHGVGTVISGERMTMGLIFHDARGRRP